MNIDDLKNAVKAGMVATLEGLILAYTVYAETTTVNVNNQINAIEDEITAIKGL